MFVLRTADCYHSLAKKIFRLKHPHVQLSEKLALKREVLEALVVHDMASLYETLSAERLLELNESILERMRWGIEFGQYDLDKSFRYVEKYLRNNRRYLQEAHLDACLLYMCVADKDKALEQFEVTESLTDDVVGKMELVLYKLLNGFFHQDFDLISQIIQTNKPLFDVQYCPERTKQYNVYEALYWLRNRDYKKAAALFLASIQDFPDFRSFLPYNTLVCYTVLSSITVLDASGLQEKFLNDGRMADVIGSNECVSRFLKSVINNQFSDSTFKDLLHVLKFDMYFYPNELEYVIAVGLTVLPNKTLGMWTEFQRAVKRVSPAMKDPQSNVEINVLDEISGLAEQHTELVHIVRTTESPLSYILEDFYNGRDLEEMVEGLRRMFDRLRRESWNESSKFECFEVGFRLHSLASETSNKAGHLLFEFITEFGDLIQSVLLHYVTKKVKAEDVNLDFKWVFEYGYDYCSLLRRWLNSDST